jgi:hypothetical protein
MEHSGSKQLGRGDKFWSLFSNKCQRELNTLFKLLKKMVSCHVCQIFVFENTYTLKSTFFCQFNLKFNFLLLKILIEICFRNLFIRFRFFQNEFSNQSQKSWPHGLETSTKHKYGGKNTKTGKVLWVFFLIGGFFKYY